MLFRPYFLLSSLPFLPLYPSFPAEDTVVSCASSIWICWPLLNQLLAFPVTLAHLSHLLFTLLPLRLIRVSSKAALARLPISRGTDAAAPALLAGREPEQALAEPSVRFERRARAPALGAQRGGDARRGGAVEPQAAAIGA
eukprot:3067075-Pleurochrysis_carterae.AAC.1